MSGMLNQGMGSLGGMGGQMGQGQMDPMQLMQMLQMQQKDPFSRSLPGDGLMGPGGMSAPPQAADLANMGGHQQDPQQGLGLPQTPDMNTISTDFTDTQPGLPNLPDNFQGFGFGQYAPKVNEPSQMSLGNMGGRENNAQPGVRQQMIQQLMQHLMSQGMGQQSRMNPGFGGM